MRTIVRCSFTEGHNCDLLRTKTRAALPLASGLAAVTRSLGATEGRPDGEE